jgi:hypothetical protein
MPGEKPHPDMDDQRVLEKLLPIALSLIETDRDRGDVLYQIFKYLEDRLGPGLNGLAGESTGDLEESVQETEQIPEDLQDDFQGENDLVSRVDDNRGNVNIFMGCHIDNVTINNH